MALLTLGWKTSPGDPIVITPSSDASERPAAFWHLVTKLPVSLQFRTADFLLTSGTIKNLRHFTPTCFKEPPAKLQHRLQPPHFPRPSRMLRQLIAWTS